MNEDLITADTSKEDDTHPKGPGYICECCPYKTKWSSNLKRHVDMKHSSNPSGKYKEKKVERQCCQCGKIYMSGPGLWAHIALVHDDKYKFKCDVCGRKYLNKAVFKKHMMSHDSVKHFQCATCVKNFKYESSLTSHVKICVLKDAAPQHVCSYCGKVFTRISTLNEHIQTLHLQTAKKWECECGKTFAWRPSLARHKKGCSKVIFEDI